MAMRILFPDHKMINMGTPRKDFFMSGRYGTLSGPERASYSSKKYDIKTGLNSKWFSTGLDGSQHHLSYPGLVYEQNTDVQNPNFSKIEFFRIWTCQYTRNFTLNSNLATVSSYLQSKYRLYRKYFFDFSIRSLI